MKVLVISHMYPSDFNSMSGIFVQKQVRALKNLGCSVIVVSPVPKVLFPLNLVSSKWQKYSKLPYEKTLDDVKVYYPRYVALPRNYLFSASGTRMYNGIKNLIFKLYEKYKFDVIHSNVALPDGYAAMLINKKLNISHVVTIHGQDFQYTINKSEKLKQKVFEVLDDADKVIAVSNKLKNVVRNQKFYNKVEVINNGVDIKDCIAQKSLTKKDDKYINILSVSNLVKTKGIDYNIKAVSNLIKKYPNIRYFIVGDGAYKDELLKLVEQYEISDNVIFTGKLEHKEVMKYMKKCDIFSLPSYKEGFGVVYIECMLQGKPVIGIKGEGIEDVIVNYENGILVNPKDVDDLQHAIEFLIKNNEKAVKIAENARQTVVNKFTWDVNAEKTLRAYKNAVNKHKL